MRIVAIADTHGQLPAIPPCDLLLVAGDVCPHLARPVGSDADCAGQARWLDTTFRRWLDDVPARDVVATWGNHDFVGERAPELVPTDLRWRLLVDAAATVQGLRIWASPWQPWFHDWAFNAPPGLAGEAFLAMKFAAVPDDTDVLICHGPPRGHGDVTTRGVETGSTALALRIAEVGPRLSVHGHIHEGRGRWDMPNDRGTTTTIANASVLDVAYQLVHAPMVFELP